jgi:hypothetical protein
LNQVLAAYLRAVDAGQRPDRQALLAKHPEPSADLRDFFVEQDRLDSLAEPLRQAPAAWHNEFTLPVGGESVPTTSPATAGSDSPPALETLGRFGDYQLLEELARGGMGVVYKARQPSLDRLVALKTIRSGEEASEAGRQRFRNEALAVASLDHPHIVPIYDVGEEQGRLYYCMKLMEGGALSRRLSSFAEDPRAAVRLLIPVAQAVHDAHQHGILHRDLKPSNILLSKEGVPHVTDFGLLKRVGRPDAPELTRSGDVLGTPGYMAPEQALGRRGAITTACDVYGLGAILYALLTGRAPFVGEEVLDVLDRLREQDPNPPSRTNPRVERDLERICLKCLEKEPARRYPSALALAEELQRYLEGRSLLLTRQVGTVERLWRWCRRNRAVAALAGVVALAILIVATVSLTAAIRLKLDNEREHGSRIQAEENRDLALQAITTFFTRVSENGELRARGLETFRRDLLAQARQFTEQLVRVQSDDLRLQTELARAYLGLGQITERLGSRGEAMQHYRQAEEIFERLSDLAAGEQTPALERECKEGLAQARASAGIAATVPRSGLLRHSGADQDPRNGFGSEAAARAPGLPSADSGAKEASRGLIRSFFK